MKTVLATAVFSLFGAAYANAETERSCSISMIVEENPATASAHCKPGDIGIIVSLETPVSVVTSVLCSFDHEIVVDRLDERLATITCKLVSPRSRIAAPD